MSKTIDGSTASQRTLNGLNNFVGSNGEFEDIDLNGNLYLSATSNFVISGDTATTGQVVKKTATGMEWADDVGGIDLTEDTTGSSPLELVLSNSSTGTSKTDFNTSNIEYTPSTQTLGSSASNFAGTAEKSNKVYVNDGFSGATPVLLTVNAVGSGFRNTRVASEFKYNATDDAIEVPNINLKNVSSTQKILINDSFSTAGKVLKISQDGTKLEYGDDDNDVGIDLTSATDNVAYELVLSSVATATDKRDFVSGGITYNPSLNLLGGVNDFFGGTSLKANQIKVNSTTGAETNLQVMLTDVAGGGYSNPPRANVNLLYDATTNTLNTNIYDGNELHLPTSGKIKINNAFGTEGQILKVATGATGMSWEDETVGINVLQTGAAFSGTYFPILATGASTNVRQYHFSSAFKINPGTGGSPASSLILFDGISNGQLILNSTGSKILLGATSQITFNNTFGSAGQVPMVDATGSFLEYATPTSGVDITDDGTTNSSFGLVFGDTTGNVSGLKKSANLSGLHYIPNATNRKLTLNGIFQQSKDCFLISSSASGTVFNVKLPDYGHITIYDGVSSYPTPTTGYLLGAGANGMTYIDPSTLGGAVDVVASSSSSAIPILFQTAQTGVSQVLNKAGFTFKPSSNELTVGATVANNVSLTTSGQLICNSGVFNLDRSPAADVRIMFKSGGTDKWRLGNTAATDLFNIQNLTLTTTPFSIKADDTIVFNAGLEYTGVQYIKNTNGDIQMSIEQGGAITITETLGVGQVNSAGRDLTVGSDGLEVNGASFLKGTVYLQNVPDFTGSSTCFVPILRPGTGDETSGTFKNDSITFTANTQTLNIKNLNFVASSSKIQLEGTDGNNQFLKVNSGGALEFASGTGGGVNVADDTTSGERPIVFSNAATPATTLGINSNLTYQPNSGRFAFKGDAVFAVGVGGEAAQQGAKIVMDSRFGEAGTNKISLFGTAGYGFGVDASTLKIMSPADHVFFTGSANDSNGNEALVINDDDEFIFAPSSTARVLGTTGSAKAFFEGRVVVGGPGNAGIWFKDDSDPATAITSGNPFIGLNGDGNWRVYINGNKLNINQNGTQTHTIGSNYARFQNSSTEFTQIRRYGVETQRSTSYIRPANTGNGTLYIGNIFYKRTEV